MCFTFYHFYPPLTHALSYLVTLARLAARVTSNRVTCHRYRSTSSVIFHLHIVSRDRFPPTDNKKTKKKKKRKTNKKKWCCEWKKKFFCIVSNLPFLFFSFFIYLSWKVKKTFLFSTPSFPFPFYVISTGSKSMRTGMKMKHAGFCSIEFRNRLFQNCFIFLLSYAVVFLITYWHMGVFRFYYWIKRFYCAKYISTLSILLQYIYIYIYIYSLNRAEDRLRERLIVVVTHTHTHIYIYIYIYCLVYLYNGVSIIVCNLIYYPSGWNDCSSSCSTVKPTPGGYGGSYPLQRQ